MPKVSVILPTYNRIAFLAEAVRSVTEQTLGDVELIVVDDGSSPEAARSVTEVAARSSARFIAFEQHLGQAAALRNGAEKARGEFVAIFADDDVFFPEKLEKQVRLLESDRSIGVCYTGLVKIDADGRRLGRVEIADVEGTGEPVLAALMKRNFITAPTTVLMRPECLREAGSFNLDLQGPIDRDLWFRVAATERWTFRRVPEVLLAYRQHGGNISLTQPIRHRRERIALLETWRSRLPALWDAGAQRELARDYYKLGRFLLREGSRLEARSVLRSAIRLRPRALRPYLRLLQAWR